MNKENNRSAAGLRRSAIVERIRLREEWSALKETGDTRNKQAGVLKRSNVTKNIISKGQSGKKNVVKSHMPADALCGVVALVDVGTERRALPLRAALTALGASVVPKWTPLVTHVVWSQGGMGATRARARALACRLVSPLWVEGCAAAARRLPEEPFPAAARPSDLPSPRTLRALLKRAEQENLTLAEVLNDSKDDSGAKPRLRISTDTEQDTSTDRSLDTSRNTSANTTTGIESRVNTAPRRALPKTSSILSPSEPKKSRRKLFTQKETETIHKSSDESEEEAPNPKTQRSKPTAARKQPKGLTRAEHLARRIVAACNAQHNVQPRGEHATRSDAPRIVLTGMGRKERQQIAEAIRSLNGRIQSQVNKKTTHVLLGSCQEDDQINPNDQIPGTSNNVILNTNNSDTTKVTVSAHQNISFNRQNTLKTVNNSQVTVNTDHSQGIPNTVVPSHMIKVRTVNALAGAARGCRVLHAKWALDSAAEKKWLHHHGYEVPHLKKLSQKALVERLALGKQRSEYAYDVFNGMRVGIASSAIQKEAAKQLLTLCGAVVYDNVGEQNGGALSADFDITIGAEQGQICSKWVFDSVAASRMRTVRRYKNFSSNNHVDAQYLHGR